MGRKLRSPTLERLDEYNRQQTGGVRNAGDPVNDPVAIRARAERAQHAAVASEAVRFHGGRCTGAARRWCSSAKASTTTSTNRSATTSAASTIVDATRDAIAAATRGNVSIYAIDPRGLVTPGADLIESSGGAFDEPNLGLGVQSAMKELRLSQDSLRELADETGGFAAVNRDGYLRHPDVQPATPAATASGSDHRASPTPLGGVHGAVHHPATTAAQRDPDTVPVGAGFCGASLTALSVTWVRMLSCRSSSRMRVLRSVSSSAPPRPRPAATR